MLFRTHVVFGIVCYFLLGYFIEMPFFVLGFVLLGSVFVDVDSCRSKAGNRFWLRPLQWMTRHRGFLHSFTGAVFFSLVVGFFNLWAGFGFFIGYISHLFLDCFTLRGVGLLWPLKFKVRGFIRSGSWAEDVVFVLFLFSNLFLFLDVIINYLL